MKSNRSRIRTLFAAGAAVAMLTAFGAPPAFACPDEAFPGQCSGGNDDGSGDEQDDGSGDQHGLVPGLGDPGAVAKLSQEQINNITPAQMANITPAQMANITPAQIRYFRPAQISALRPNVFGGMKSTQLGALKPAVARGVTVEQLAALSNRQVKKLAKKFVNALDRAQKVALTTA